MAVQETIGKLRSYFETEKKVAEGSEVAGFFPETYGASSLQGLLEDFSFKEDDEKWTDLHRDPAARYNETRGPLLRIAFLSAGLRDIRAFYTSGSDDHSFTDVDALRSGPHFTNNQLYRLDHIEARLKD